MVRGPRLLRLYRSPQDYQALAHGPHLRNEALGHDCLILNVPPAKPPAKPPAAGLSTASCLREPGASAQRDSGPTGAVHPGVPQIPGTARARRCPRCTGSRGHCTGRCPGQRRPLQAEGGLSSGVCTVPCSSPISVEHPCGVCGSRSVTEEGRVEPARGVCALCSRFLVSWSQYKDHTQMLCPGPAGRAPGFLPSSGHTAC